MPVFFDRLVIATHNKGKLSEFAELLRPIAANVVSAGDLELPEPEENGTSFVENALIKARAAAEASRLPSLADDSGLCVNALDGQPGIYTARWMGPNKEPLVGMNRVLSELKTQTDRSAYFMCILAMVWPDGRYVVFEGRVNGVIADAPRGAMGHGYDPVFIPDGFTQTYAELPMEKKNSLSHRGLAIKALIQHFTASN